jgi:hypothetical protein
MFKIEKPGIYLGVPAADYHADCCPTPSLSRSLAHVLCEESPWHAWHKHPRLNPNVIHEDSRRLDLGTIAHALLIGQGRDFQEILADNYMTKAAKEQRDLARAEGKTPVLTGELARARAMVDVCRRQLGEIEGCQELFTPDAGAGEVVIAWQEEHVWCRALIDWLPHDRRVFADYKTTVGSANPIDLGKAVVNFGYELQGAFYEEAIAAIEPECAGRIQPVFIFQEIDPPYAISAITLDEEAMTVGRKKFAKALSSFGRCLETGVWPNYAQVVTPVLYPHWALSKWLDREAIDELREKQGDYDPIGMVRVLNGGRAD